jgi:hypothetical protein
VRQVIRLFSNTRFAALTSLALLSACANNQKSVIPLTDISTRECAASFDLSKAVALAFDGKREFIQSTDIDETTPCVKGANGAALYVVYALPASDVPYVISVSSLAAGSTMFAPRVMMLGGDGAVKREFSGSAIEFRGSGLGVMIRNHADETYLVIASDPAVAGHTNSRIVEATQVYTGSTGYGTYQVHTGTDTNEAYTLAHNGRVAVTLTPIEKPK